MVQNVHVDTISISPSAAFPVDEAKMGMDF